MDEIDDRELLKNVLQSMSQQMSGQTAEGLIPNDAFAVPQPVDVPEGPMDPADPRMTETPDGQPHPHAKSSQYAWGGYENGRIPAKALKAIGQGGHRLEVSAADAWIAMREAAAREGITLKLTDSYRSYEQQVSVRQRKGHQVATATPGTSVHGWGRAVDADVGTAATLAWLRAHAGQFGWINPEWAQRSGKSHEPWHWEYVGGGS